ncbi:TPA: hypothetical protein TZC45_001728 [Streptococcus suis]|jgi:hypothetical protein|uniref:hypothetical protein n=1 Tax=Streptococcus suis TaxID=1307 RepID=UPI0015568D49|nr:hypothetical protein [Streptococcus suis]NQP31429.1 hypothetical protein [Streptococcus suis]NQP33726.1 hypothetical protein [Streptococcus suis]NQP36147.1 hypothetical protein [Streptococcus suis]HEL2151006.1 hypothetical protein [Streptococcus suis]
MKKLSIKQSSEVVGGYRWKCKHTYHSKWAGNTFVSSWHAFFDTANTAMNEHRRTYGHTDTWISA